MEAPYAKKAYLGSSMHQETEQRGEIKKKKERDYIFLNRFKMLTNTTVFNGYY